MHAIQNLNHTLFLLVNAGATTPHWWINLAVFVANDLVYGVPVLLIGLWLAGGPSRRGAALLAFAIAMVALGANQLIGLAWYQPRPFVIGLGHTWTSHVPDASFPSDHLTLFTSIGLGLLLAGLKRVGAATLVVGLLVGWARVYVGLHFPLDMAGSLMVATLCSALIVPLWQRMGAAGTRPASRASTGRCWRARLPGVDFAPDSSRSASFEPSRVSPGRMARRSSLSRG